MAETASSDDRQRLSTSAALPQSIGIRIKMQNDQTFSLRVAPDVSISELKASVQTSSLVPPARQRLIYRGKLLRDNDILSTYNVQDGHTVHMVARPENIPVPSASTSASTLSSSPASTSTPSERRPPRNETLESLRRRLAEIQMNDTDDTRASRSNRTPSPRLEELRRRWEQIRDEDVIPPAMRSNYAAEPEPESSIASSAPPLPRLPQTSPSSSVEHLRQGLLTVQTLLARERTFFVGQWLDVKDTVNQWLEATVLQVHPGQIFVHYNGWPSRWNEWIDNQSPRLAPFRAKTRHASQRFSPEPLLPSLAAREAPPATATSSLSTLLPQLRLALQMMLPHMDTLVEATQQEEPVDAMMAPLFDRLGRLFIDAAPLVQAMSPSSSSPSRQEDEEDRESATESSSFWNLISTTGPSSGMALRRMIDVHIHAVIAPPSFASSPALENQWRQGSTIASGPAIETSAPFIEDSAPPPPPLESASPSSSPSRAAPSFLDVIRRTMDQNNGSIAFTRQQHPLDERAVPSSSAEVAQDDDLQ
ncbi:unnamed protein product [Aphanomyces euteiches]|uniref:Ubiquitin-like domain-containing protein n=1 Tax=Aphanomyces euteiches TaxID=100861 RepID=A0A6G0WAL1_9STRA|nr:hypothetical protein Ae201684_017295 [Aphanomyces euteiches]KAH9145142.1 hypothetical protein AeRB84_010957 [Aphanomyces euteiches]